MQDLRLFSAANVAAMGHWVAPRNASDAVLQAVLQLFCCEDVVASPLALT